MYNFFNFDFQILATFARDYPYGFDILTYFLCFFEAIAIIGVIVPGAIVMPAIGFLIGSSVIPAIKTITLAILGTLTGDIISYLIGAHFSYELHHVWPFTMFPNLLKKGENFFCNHGSKSVFIGRFVGPVRAIISLIAGMTKMSFLKFFFTIIPSAIIWAICYMLPGIFLGALSLDLPKKFVTKFSVIILIIFFVIWLLVYITKHFLKKLLNLLDTFIRKCLHVFFVKKNFIWISKFLSLSDNSNDYKINNKQLLLLFCTIFNGIVFLSICFCIIVGYFPNYYEHTIHYLISSFRSKKLDILFIFITFFGDVKFLIIMTFFITIWLTIKKQYNAMYYVIGNFIFSLSIISIIKYILHTPRPADTSYALFSLDKSSFPSAHITLGISYYGFLISKIFKKYLCNKFLSYFVFSILLIFLFISRIYLGVHWLIDLIGGVFLGIFLLSSMILYYNKFNKSDNDLYLKNFILIISSILILTFSIYSFVELKVQIKKYEIYYKNQLITFDYLLKNDSLPIIRYNRLGQPIETFNIIYIGKLDEIKKFLLLDGWILHNVENNFFNIIKNLFDEKKLDNNPICFLRQPYHQKNIAFLSTKNIKNNKGEITLLSILRLWKSDINLLDNKDIVWIGIIDYRPFIPIMFSFDLIHSDINNNYIDTTKFSLDFKNSIKNNFWYKDVSQKLSNSNLLILKSNN